MMHRDNDTEIWRAVWACKVHGADKSSGCGVCQGASSPHIKFWDPLFISETDRARKLQFGTLVGIYEY